MSNNISDSNDIITCNNNNNINSHRNDITTCDNNDKIYIIITNNNSIRLFNRWCSAVLSEGYETLPEGLPAKGTSNDIKFLSLNAMINDNYLYIFIDINIM